MTQGYYLSMVLYGITLVPLEKDLQAEVPGLLTMFYANDVAFNGFAWRSAQFLKLLLNMGSDQGLFPRSIQVTIYS